MLMFNKISVIKGHSLFNKFFVHIKIVLMFKTISYKFSEDLSDFYEKDKQRCKVSEKVEYLFLGIPLFSKKYLITNLTNQN